VLKYAQEKDKTPYKNIEQDWKERERELRNYYDTHLKVRKWEGMVEDYMRKRSGDKETLFNYNKLPGNPTAKQSNQDKFKEDYNPNHIVLPSELAQAEHEAKKAKESLKMKELEVDKLKDALAKEKSKGFLKRLFS
jgi:hypothetical protein